MSLIPVFESLQNAQNAKFGLPSICCFNDQMVSTFQAFQNARPMLSDEENDLVQDLWIKYANENNTQELSRLQTLMTDLQEGSPAQQNQATKELRSIVKKAETVDVRRAGLQSTPTLKDGNAKPNKQDWQHSAAAIREQRERSANLGEMIDKRQQDREQKEDDEVFLVDADWRLNPPNKKQLVDKVLSMTPAERNALSPQERAEYEEVMDEAVDKQWSKEYGKEQVPDYMKPKMKNPPLKDILGKINSDIDGLKGGYK